jgi:Rrf2 family iron-sulfur cluster assembly transcriptional regulator
LTPAPKVDILILKSGFVAMFRSDVQHALRALAALARSGQPLAIPELSRRVLTPEPMLAKVMHGLARLGLVIGQPGPGGGYHLARAAAAIRLADVVLPLEGPDFARSCLFGLPHCSDEAPCPLHPVWGSLRAGLLDAIDSWTVADLARDAAEGGRRRGRSRAADRGAGRARSQTLGSHRQRSTAGRTGRS